MDLDLWGPPCDLGSCCRTLPEQQHAFYFGWDFDEIEEDALNEKSCVQVLRILINKADTEIDELERNLSSLQSELVCRSEEWFEIGCNALREKIKCLDISIRTLKNKDKNDMEVHLLLHTQPVESLHEILKDLLGENLQKKNEQSKDGRDAIVSNTSSDAATEYSTSLTPTLKLQKKKTNSSKTIKHAEVNMCSITEPSKHAVGKSSRTESNLVIEEVEENSSVSSRMPVMKKANLVKTVKPANAVVKDLRLGASRNSCGHFAEMNNFCNAVVEVTGNEEIKEHSRATAKSKILISSLVLQGKGDNPGTSKTADSIVKSISAPTLRYKAGLNVKKEKSDYSDLGTLNQVEGSNQDMHQKLCDLAPRAACKRAMRASKIAATVLSSSPKKKGTNETKAGESGLSPMANFTLTPLLELQDQATERTKMAIIAADKKGPNFIQTEMAKRNSNLLLIQDIGFPKGKVVSSSCTSKGNKRKKTGVTSLNSNLSQPLSEKITEKLVLPGKCEDDGREKSAKFPTSTKIKDTTSQMGFLNSVRDTNGSARNNDLSVAEITVSGSCYKAVASLPSGKSCWDQLRVSELRAIAKGNKLTNYSKLNKSALVAKLTNEIGNPYISK